MQETRRPRVDPWVGKVPWRRKWQPTPVFLPGESRPEEPGELQSRGSQRVEYGGSDFTHAHAFFLDIH